MAEAEAGGQGAGVSAPHVTHAGPGGRGLSDVLSAGSVSQCEAGHPGH